MAAIGLIGAKLHDLHVTGAAGKYDRHLRGAVCVRGEHIGADRGDAVTQARAHRRSKAVLARSTAPAAKK